MDRLWLILALLSLPHCSSSSEAIRLRGGENIESASEGIGQSGIVTKSSGGAEEPKAGENDPATASSPPASTPAPAPGPSSPPEKPAEAPAQLPSVTLESDKALKPIPILGVIGAPPIGVPYTSPPIYAFAKQSGDSDIDLGCDQSDPLTSLIKCFLESNGAPQYVNPANVSWTVTISNCPTFVIRGNVDFFPCGDAEDSTCDSVRPGAWMRYQEKDMKQCIANQAQLIFKLTDKTSDKTSSVIFSLKQVTP